MNIFHYSNDLIKRLKKKIIFELTKQIGIEADIS